MANQMKRKKIDEKSTYLIELNLDFSGKHQKIIYKEPEQIDELIAYCLVYLNTQQQRNKPKNFSQQSVTIIDYG